MVDRICRARCDGIPESHVHLGNTACVGELAVQRDPHAAVACILSDNSDANRCRIENDAVVGRDRRDVSENTGHRAGIARPESQQVGVPRRAVRQVVPERKEQRALEDEAVGVG